MVYTVIEEWNVDCEPGLRVGVFQSKDDAEVRYKDLTIEAEGEGREFWKEDAAICDGTTFFEIYEEGYYSQNHITVRLLETELK